jgi:hypothetical protein
MPEKPHDYEAELRAMMDALAESAAQASDKEILAEVRESGEDPEAVAARVRGILKTAVTSYEQRRLRAAEESYRSRVEAIRRQSRAIPATPERRRELFMAIMARQPGLGAALVTLQNREFRSLTDADIHSALEQLAALGALSEFEGH